MHESQTFPLKASVTPTAGVFNAGRRRTIRGTKEFRPRLCQLETPGAGCPGLLRFGHLHIPPLVRPDCPDSAESTWSQWAEGAERLRVSSKVWQDT